MSTGSTSGLPALPSCSAPACGQTLYGMVRFCPFCGTEQKASAPAAVPAAAVPKAAPTAAKPGAVAGAAAVAAKQDAPKPGNKPEPARQAAPVQDTATTAVDPEAESTRPRKGFAPDFIPNAPTQAAGLNLLQRILRTIKRIVLGVVVLVVLVAGIGVWRTFQTRADANREKETAAQAEAAKQAEARDARDKAAAAAAATRDAQQRTRQEAARAQETQRQEAQRLEAQRQESLRQEAQQREAIERDAQQTAQREAQREAQRQEAVREALRQQAANQARQRAEANQESSVPGQRARPAPVPAAPTRSVTPVPDAAPTQRLARDLLRNAREQLRNKDYNAAISTANMARGYDPDNPDIAAIVRQANEEKQRALRNTTIN